MFTDTNREEDAYGGAKLSEDLNAILKRVREMEESKSEKSGEYERMARKIAELSNELSEKQKDMNDKEREHSNKIRKLIDEKNEEIRKLKEQLEKSKQPSEQEKDKMKKLEKEKKELKEAFNNLVEAINKSQTINVDLTNSLKDIQTKYKKAFEETQDIVWVGGGSLLDVQDLTESYVRKLEDNSTGGLTGLLMGGSNTKKKAYKLYHFNKMMNKRLRKIVES
jgi:chromosome segregation ATPase